jgi:hypothetical protein
MHKAKSQTRRKCEHTANLNANSLKKLLLDANRDDKSEAKKTLLKSLRPALLELMKNKGWSSRKTAHFLKERNIEVKAVEIDDLLKSNPFNKMDVDALSELKIEQSQKTDIGGTSK